MVDWRFSGGSQRVFRRFSIGYQKVNWRFSGVSQRVLKRFSICSQRVLSFLKGSQVVLMGISGCLYNVFGRFSIERRFLKGSQGFSIESQEL